VLLFYIIHNIMGGLLKQSWLQQQHWLWPSHELHKRDHKGESYSEKKKITEMKSIHSSKPPALIKFYIPHSIYQNKSKKMVSTGMQYNKLTCLYKSDIGSVHWKTKLTKT
jgi:hypothetical protein